MTSPPDEGATISMHPYSDGGGGGPERMGNLQTRVWLGERSVGTFIVVHFGCRFVDALVKDGSI